MSLDPQSLLGDLEAHGELHAIVEEHDDELELRLGQTDIMEDGRILVTSYGETHVFHCDRIVSYYMPEEIWH